MTLPQPPLVGARSGLLLIEDSEQSAVFAFDLQPENPRLPQVFFREQAEIHLMLYGCPLERTGLQAGAVPLKELPDERASIGAPYTTYRISTEGAQSQDWEAIAWPEGSAQELLRRINLPEESFCNSAVAQFTSEQITVTLEGQGQRSRFARALGDGTVLVGGPQGELFLVDAQARLLPPLTGLVTADVHVGREGELWLLSELGGLYRGDLNEVTQVSTSPILSAREGRSGRLMVRLAGPGPAAPSAPLELFVVSDEASFERYDGQAWETVAEGEGRDRSAHALWLGTAEALGAGGSSPAVLVRYKDGLVIEEPLPTQSAIQAVARVKGQGTFVGTRSGDLIWQGDQGWSEVAHNDDLPAQIAAFASLERGLLVLGGEDRLFPSNPVLGQVLPGARWCPMEPVTAQMAFLVAQMEPGRYLLVEFTVNRGLLDMTILQQTRAQARCSVPAGLD